MPTFVLRPGHPLADKDGFVDKDLAGEVSRPNGNSLYIMRDTPEYLSPLGTGLISGRVARREDLKRGNCREVDPSEKMGQARSEKWARRLGVEHNPNAGNRPRQWDGFLKD
jgi:hypothetical protein